MFLESWEYSFGSIVFQCFLFSKSNARVWNWLQVKACSRWWLFTVFQHCSDKNSRCRSEMNILAAWQRGYTGRNVVVTILDDGIERNHPDLAQNYVRWSWSIIAVNAFYQGKTLQAEILFFLLTGQLLRFWVFHNFSSLRLVTPKIHYLFKKQKQNPKTSLFYYTS